MGQDLDGRRIHVTGGGRGLGRAITELCLERGAQVVISDVDAALGEATASELGIASVQADVRDFDAVAGAVRATVDALGGLDVMVNNAGIEIAKPLVEHSTEEFERLLSINVTGVFHGIKAATPALAAGNLPAIVNMASVAGIGGAALLGAYCASKAAVVNMTRVAAIELRDAGIRVNCVCPAFVDTSMVERLIPIYEPILPLPFDEVVKLKQGRMGEPSDVAEVVAFLASDDCTFVTGAPFVLDGALSASLL